MDINTPPVTTTVSRQIPSSPDSLLCVAKRTEAMDFTPVVSPLTVLVPAFIGIILILACLGCCLSSCWRRRPSRGDARARGPAPMELPIIPDLEPNEGAAISSANPQAGRLQSPAPAHLPLAGLPRQEASTSWSPTTPPLPQPYDNRTVPPKGLV